ncbi:hypothetical protein BJF93_03745 [Xaviernesmea oryzae]|uniref:Uncharacterized protein n=1 Tax=Xaviernesmea oryzae TaxID=464029 RepID=A0A1Q9AUC6_9HYPH|nr:hypothetical protein [Xaviernesmea oryzae]OLP59049.1 hypothetical protein BJF93_03745 [Xaviernesmea oryzae]SEK89039.1 hypothetical protein SAMN04487976_104296 [Xaviernesmea oryzae]
MPDRFTSHAPTITGPATRGFSITPSDSAALPEVTRALYVGSSGAVALRLIEGQTVTFSGLAAGTLLPLRADRVLATGTTAGNLLGLA